MKSSVLSNFYFQSYLLNLVLKGYILNFYHIQHKQFHFYVMGEEAMTENGFYLYVPNGKHSLFIHGK
jgi:hypothetical protein